MNWLDLVILLIVGLSAALGLKIGLIRVGIIEAPRASFEIQPARAVF